MTLPAKFEHATLTTKANIYFEGKVVSHGLELPDGSKKTVGIIYPGSFRFNTGAPEKMEIVAGRCQVRLAGEREWKTISSGEAFEVPEKSYFEISVAEGIAEYICSFQ